MTELNNNEPKRDHSAKAVEAKMNSPKCFVDDSITNLQSSELLLGFPILQKAGLDIRKAGRRVETAVIKFRIKPAVY